MAAGTLANRLIYYDALHMRRQGSIVLFKGWAEHVRTCFPYDSSRGAAEMRRL
jgi:hypothetical protein